MLTLGCAMWWLCKSRESRTWSRTARISCQFKETELKDQKQQWALTNSFRSPYDSIEESNKKIWDKEVRKAVVRECFMDEVGTTVDLEESIFFLIFYYFLKYKSVAANFRSSTTSSIICHIYISISWLLLYLNFPISLFI